MVFTKPLFRKLHKAFIFHIQQLQHSIHQTQLIVLNSLTLKRTPFFQSLVLMLDILAAVYVIGCTNTSETWRATSATSVKGSHNLSAHTAPTGHARRYTLRNTSYLNTTYFNSDSYEINKFRICDSKIFKPSFFKVGVLCGKLCLLYQQIYPKFCLQRSFLLVLTFQVYCSVQVH